MSWDASTGWWIGAGALIAAELSIGTFYLLMVALGAGAGALAAHLGLAAPVQWLVAAVVGAGATAVWHVQRARQPQSAPAALNRDVNLDIGQHLQVPLWAADGSARVQYRGAAWSVRFVGDAAPAPGEHIIVSVQGSQLGVAPAARQQAA
jgi:membrane protein implicated in regulation of membrane protease activity